MSHVVAVELVVTDLDALEAAAKHLGLELRRGQKTYKWYGMFVGYSPLPAGVTKDQLGKCDHAVRVVGNAQAYEIGLSKFQQEDGSEAYRLLYDFWNGGYGLVQKVGEGCQMLRQRYGYEVACRKAADLGWSLASEEVLPNGEIRLEFEAAQQQAWSGQGAW